MAKWKLLYYNHIRVYDPNPPVHPILVVVLTWPIIVVSNFLLHFLVHSF